MDNKGKVFLCYLPSLIINREDVSQEPLENTLYPEILPPTDLMYLASIAENCGFNCSLKDYRLGGNIINDIFNIQPHFLVTTISTPTFSSDMTLLKQIKEQFPAIKIIVKGSPFLTYNNNAIYENNFIDYVMYGECEFTLKDILSEVDEKEITGLCYRENFQAIKNEPRQFIENLDILPFPARHLIDNSKYKNPYLNKTQAIINVSRGCPYNCLFCLATPISGSKVRYRSASSIIKEIKDSIDKYNIKHFLFISDIFNFDTNWLSNLCNEIISNKLNITWSANFRPGLIDNSIAKLMYKSGCRLVSLGIESSNQKILDLIGKQTKVKDIIQTTKILKQNHIKTLNNFIIGLPWDTENSIKENIRFAITLNSNFIKFNIATPFPGTKFFVLSMINKLVEDKLDFTQAYQKPIVKTQTLSKKQIASLHKFALKKYYLKPLNIIKYILNIKHISDIKRFIKFYKNLFSN